jgi:peptidoglycan hydrolase CwlO-like protein
MRIVSDKLSQEEHYWYSLCLIYLSYLVMIFTDRYISKVEKENISTKSIHNKEKEILTLSLQQEMQSLKDTISQKDKEIEKLNKEIDKKNIAIVK